MDSVDKSVCVLLPAHNEAECIAQVVAGCIEHTPRLSEVLVVDDGSTDETGERAREAGARVLRLDPNRGKGHAVRRGLESVDADIVVLLDADGQDLPEEIPLVLGALTPDVDLVVGSRFLGRLEPGSITPLNRLGNLALTHLFNLLLGQALTDTQAGFRAIRRETLLELDLEAGNYDIETDMLVRLLARQGRVVEVPVSRLPRGGGRTDFHRLHDGLRILSRMVRAKIAAPSS